MASAVLLALKTCPSSSHLPRPIVTPRLRVPPCSDLPIIPPGNGIPLGRKAFLKENPMNSPFSCSCKFGDNEVSEVNWSLLKRWNVPWEWQTVLLTMLACGFSFTLSGLAEVALLSFLGQQGGELTLDGKAELLFAGQLFSTVVVLGILFSITSKFEPLADDILCYDLRRPFDLKNGWLLWAVIGLLSSVVAIYLTGVVLTLFNGGDSKRETDALISLLPLLGSSSVSTACLLCITGVLAPLLEETVFRGFLMTSLTKWVPTPISVVISAAAFSLAHLTPGEFPQLFVLGTMLGFSYGKTRNLLTPITIHALWNSGVIILLTFLQLQGYDIRELLQGSS